MFQNIKKIHFIGIGGIGMSALAMILHSKGFEISGSNLSNSSITEHLVLNKIKVYFENKASHISSDIDLVISTLAIEEDNEELSQAREYNIKSITYPQAVGMLTDEYKLISICGSHGKSTSTAMIANVLKKGNLDPTVIIGTKVAEFHGRNYRVGKSEYFVLESCEYKEAFLSYKPYALLITNIDPDHLDYYKTEENYLKAFEKYIGNLREEGVLVVNGDDENLKKVVSDQWSVVSEKNIKIIKFGEDESNDYVLKGNDIYFGGKKVAGLDLQVPGLHNRMNALGVFALSDALGMEKNVILESLNHFGGTWRRLELKGKLKNGALLYDDYAHHPTEIQASLAAMRELYPDKNLICVFQPHQHSRTKFLLEGFTKSFSDADQVVIPNIYQVRDSHSDIESISAETLVKEISKNHKNAVYGDGFEKTAQYLKENSTANDVIIIMGAGDIEKLPNIILE